ncbi:MAG: hypothetical protein ACKPH7_34455 [Planktothrix sp.]|uniref:hypothetical protein n=1 Tax=Planktothrix sp. TaxID=3088171 RepID=UPI0038D3A0A0
MINSEKKLLYYYTLQYYKVIAPQIPLQKASPFSTSQKSYTYGKLRERIPNFLPKKRSHFKN